MGTGQLTRRQLTSVQKAKSWTENPDELWREQTITIMVTAPTERLAARCHFKHLHPLPLLILQPYEIGKIITYANEEDKAKGALQTHFPRKAFHAPWLRSSHTGIPTRLPKPDRLSHTIFPSEMPLLISAYFNAVHPSRRIRNGIASDFPMQFAFWLIQPQVHHLPYCIIACVCVWACFYTRGEEQKGLESCFVCLWSCSVVSDSLRRHEL